jgi:hypothetical protein
VAPHRQHLCFAAERADGFRGRVEAYAAVPKPLRVREDERRRWPARSG